MALEGHSALHWPHCVQVCWSIDRFILGRVLEKPRQIKLYSRSNYDYWNSEDHLFLLFCCGTERRRGSQSTADLYDYQNHAEQKAGVFGWFFVTTHAQMEARLTVKTLNVLVARQAADLGVKAVIQLDVLRN